MKVFRKISFYILTVGVLGLILADRLRIHPPLGPFLLLAGTVSVFALFVWAFAFLKEEPILTRIALVILAACMAALVYMIGTGGDSY
jgi:hypothetical protein